jgi:DNA-binding response OmpR family regulator
MHVLVLEDEPIIGFALEDMLLQIGCDRVTLATRISEAQQIASEVKLDAAILDVNIHGAQSYPVADALAARRVPYIFATGYGDRAHPDQHRDTLTLTKPYSIDDIRAGLRKAIERGVQSGAS